MTDNNALYEYRLNQAKTTLDDAEVMLKENISPRSIINRAYYSAFYIVLALFLKEGIQTRTSRHSGVIGIFDKEFILKGKISKRCSQILHGLFDNRQEFDYKEFATVDQEDAVKAVKDATEFVDTIFDYINQQEKS